MKLVEKLTMDIFNQCIQYFETDENKTKIQENIINPIIIYISEQITLRMYNYFLFLNTLFILTFFLVIIILIMIIQKK